MFKEKLKSIGLIKYYLKGKKILNDQHYQNVQEKSKLELLKKPSKTEIINYLLSKADGETSYLEIGVSNPDANYNHIIANKKYSGKFMVRLPPEVHRSLAIQAAESGVSINRLVSSRLSH